MALESPAFVPGVPQPSEYGPGFAGYVAQAQPFADPVAQLETQLGEMLALLHGLDPARRLDRYAPGKWTIQEQLGHITDTERIFAYRALRIARGDSTPLPGFEQDPYVAAAEADHCDWDNLVAEFEHVRRATILMVRNFPRDAWTRTGTTSGQPMSARAMICVILGHVAHHLAIFRERCL